MIVYPDEGQFIRDFPLLNPMWLDFIYRFLNKHVVLPALPAAHSVHRQNVQFVVGLCEGIANIQADITRRMRPQKYYYIITCSEPDVPMVPGFMFRICFGRKSGSQFETIFVIELRLETAINNIYIANLIVSPAYRQSKIMKRILLVILREFCKKLPPHATCDATASHVAMWKFLYPQTFPKYPNNTYLVNGKIMSFYDFYSDTAFENDLYLYGGGSSGSDSYHRRDLRTLLHEHGVNV